MWLLTEADEEVRSRVTARDAFVIKLKEHTGSGYLWNIDDLNAAGFLVFQDQRLPLKAERSVGGPVQRVLGARPGTSRFGRIALTQTQALAKDRAAARSTFIHL